MFAGPGEWGFPLPQIDPNHPLNQGLIGWWQAVPPLDGGRAVYDLVTGHGSLAATLSGGYSWKGTVAGPAVAFDGSSGYMLGATTFPSTPRLTIEFTIKPDQVSAPACGLFSTIDSASSWYFWAPLDTRIEWNLVGTGIDLFVNHGMSVGVAYHWVLTYDGGTASIYRNGVLLGTGTGGGTPTVGGGPWAQKFMTYRPTGAWGRLAVYSRSMSAAEAAGLYAASLLPLELDDRLLRLRSSMPLLAGASPPPPPNATPTPIVVGYRPAAESQPRVVVLSAPATAPVLATRPTVAAPGFGPGVGTPGPITLSARAATTTTAGGYPPPAVVSILAPLDRLPRPITLRSVPSSPPPPPPPPSWVMASVLRGADTTRYTLEGIDSTATVLRGTDTSVYPLP